MEELFEIIFELPFYYSIKTVIIYITIHPHKRLLYWCLQHQVAAEKRLFESTLVQFSRKVQDYASLSIVEHFSRGYACKKCFCEMEKFLVLSYKLTELENMISNKLSEALICNSSQEPMHKM